MPAAYRHAFGLNLSLPPLCRGRSDKPLKSLLNRVKLFVVGTPPLDARFRHYASPQQRRQCQRRSRQPLTTAMGRLSLAMLLCVTVGGGAGSYGVHGADDFQAHPPALLTVSGHSKAHAVAMGTYELDAGKQSHGSVRYKQQVDTTTNGNSANSKAGGAGARGRSHSHSQLISHGKEPHYLYRSGLPSGRWIIVLGEGPIAQKQGVIITKSDQNSSPVGADIKWLSAESKSRV